MVDNTSASQYAFGAGVFRWATTATITNSIIGFNTREYDAAALDLDGNPRRQGTPDMGAYENPPRGTLVIMR